MTLPLTPPTNTIDDLMDKDPLSLTKPDLATIVAYHRRNRATGPKPQRESVPAPKIDLVELGLKKPAAPSAFRR